MTLLSANEDLLQRTLAALPGHLRRLQYLAGLRDEHGGYLHWGLSRTHGDEAAQQALRRAHTEAFLEVLRAPLRELWREAEQEACGIDWSRLPREAGALAPADLGGGSLVHFSSIATALAALAARPSASHRAA